ncbi:MAG: ATP-binding protein [Rectinemataceae bacterium]|jgi:nitrogen fixation/metabolism regulation signal transduction histidine kinase
MTGPFVPRKRILPELLSVLVVYGLICLGAYAFARSVLSGSPSFPDLYERLPAALLAVLPAALIVILGFRVRSFVMDLRARRYGSRLRLRLSGLFLLIVAAASLPQGLFLIRLAAVAQSASSSREVREALSEGQALALAWYDEELGRIERAAAGLPREYAGREYARIGKSASAEILLEELRARDPRMEALEFFDGGRSTDFAGPGSARLASPPVAPAAESAGHLLAATSSGGTSLIRYATPFGGPGPGKSRAFAVLSLRMPEGLDRAAASLGKAERTASFLAPFSAKWVSLLVLLYCFLVLPLLLIAALLGSSAADLVAEPLISLEDATRRVTAGEFGVRLIVKPGDETGRLVASFNRMLGEIERSRSDELRREKIDAWKGIAQRLAHELKNPLTPIRLAAERVLKRWKTNSAQVAPIIEGSMLAIIKEVEGMDALLSDFRAFASLPEPQRDWAELAGLVADAVALYAASYPEVSFRLDGLPAGLTLRVDRAAMKRALGNLFANAIDAMEGRGEIEIAADLVKAADSRYCRLKIRDTGRGIPASLGEKVFLPYFTTKSEGTGLGLSIVERIVSEHGGTIRFESEEGEGTTFYVDLPIDR